MTIGIKFPKHGDIHLGGGHRKIMVQGQPRQKHETLSEKQTQSKKGWGYGSSGRDLT
jgi:hypothetical protein